MEEIVIRVPEEIERYLTPGLRKKIELEALREIETRLLKARKFIELAEKSELDNESAEKLSKELKEASPRDTGWSKRRLFSTSTFSSQHSTAGELPTRFRLELCVRNR